MAAEELPPALATLEDPDRARPADANRCRPVGPRQAGVTLLVCLALWAVLFAPALERTAHTAPPGARRAAALAILRPVAAISDVLAVTEATEGAMRALGRDPDGAPGGELVLPDLDVPEVVHPPQLVPVGSSDSVSPPSLPSPTTAAPTPAGRTPGRPRGMGAEPAATQIRTPTEHDRLRVVVVGDSLSQGLGPAVAELFDPSRARVLSLGKISTGLSRPDYFNWQAAMRRIVDALRPDLVFVLLGTNDDQPIVTSGGTVDLGSTDWTSAYRQRAAAFLQEATSTGTRVVWVGIPVVAERDRWGFYRRLNDVYADTAAADPLAAYVDAWSLLDARDGGYTAYLRNERGVLQQMRAGDGFHFTPNGYLYLGREAIRAAVAAFGLAPVAVEFRV
jgi:hypothetical protein